MCILHESLLFSSLILGSLFSDYVLSFTDICTKLCRQPNRMCMLEKLLLMRACDLLALAEFLAFGLLLPADWNVIV